MKKLFIALSILLQTSFATAGFIGPTTIIEGQWGAGDTAFGFESGDTRDGFPSLLVIDETGSVVIGDSLNKRIKIYNSTGNLQTYFSYKLISPEFDWPANLKAKANVGIFSLYEKLQKYDYNGNLVWAITVPPAMDFWASNDGGIWLQDYKNRNTYYLYSFTGQLIKTSTTKPPELGILQSQKIAAKQFKVTVTYPDRSWSTIRGNESLSFKRDSNGNFYGLNNNTAVRYNSCGKELGRITMPKLQYQNTAADDEDIPPTPPDAEAPRPPVALEYGAPVLAPNGDVYTWKRTPDKYSIVKWTWVDDPNTPTGPDAPANLTVAASTTGLYLTWTASPQDPGCVTGYEVSRSTTSGGTFSVITTTDKGVLNYNDTTADAGTTYYYKLRAKAGNDFSAYTSMASGNR